MAHVSKTALGVTLTVTVVTIDVIVRLHGRD